MPTIWNLFEDTNEMSHVNMPPIYLIERLSEGLVGCIFHNHNVRVRVCVCACVRACVCARVRVCVCGGLELMFCF